MKTIKVNIKGDVITSERAAAEVGINYSAISEDKQFKFMRNMRNCVKVILVSKDGYNKRYQKTFYCLPV